ncbi:MAG: redox-regulated ATPase YchF [Candidatus Izemoplasmatales bacterium]|nr:redox-regulated ATPase YchF [Candidatus Izemoplasmatales bacterium]
MGLTAGIIGLPNVGKSTLFNALTKSNAFAANFPFATIDPNIGVVEVPDARVDTLVKMYNPKKTIYTTFEFTDVAGLVRGASKGEGLGNQFLSYIRNCDAICQVVRCFDDDNIIHVEGNINPIRDVETIALELIFADMETVEKRIPKIEKRAQMKTDKDAVEEYDLLIQILTTLKKSLPIRSMNVSDKETKWLRNFNFLTAKPMLYVCNVSDQELTDYSHNTYVKQVIEIASSEGSKVCVISAKIESELSQLPDSEKAIFLEDLGVKQPGLIDLIQKSYEMLHLQTFLTVGKDEVRAWTFKKGAKAPECAGVVHTDFEKGFIRAETISYDDLIACGSEVKAKELGKIRLEGKDYIAQDGDIFHFRFNL